jgi:hypothetical protein
MITFLFWYQIQEVALRVLALLACGTPDQRRRLIEVMDFITCMNETYLEGCTQRSVKTTLPFEVVGEIKHQQAAKVLLTT